MRGTCCGGFWAAEHCVSSCKVAWTGDEGQLVCEVGAAAVGSFCVWFVPLGCSAMRDGDRIGMAPWKLHGTCVREDEGGRNIVFFCVKWLQPAMKVRPFMLFHYFQWNPHFRHVIILPTLMRKHYMVDATYLTILINKIQWVKAICNHYLWRIWTTRNECPNLWDYMERSAACYN